MPIIFDKILLTCTNTKTTTNTLKVIRQAPLVDIQFDIFASLK